MKQGMKKRLAPKPKAEKASWNKRNLARESKQIAFALAGAKAATPDTSA